MANDFEDVHGIDQLPDSDLRALIVERLGEFDDIDVERLTIHVNEGSVHLEGRVGTETELQRIEHVVTDVLGLQDVTNGIVVDDTIRARQSEAADDAAAQAAGAAPLLGEGGHRTSDTADHLLDDPESEQFGTSSMKEATERGTSYNPPTGPVQEGTWSEEDR
jgi:hypothetical protein